MFRRFHMVYQRDSMECGIACIAMLALHYGIRTSLTELEEMCDPTIEGVSLKNCIMVSPRG